MKHHKLNRRISILVGLILAIVCLTTSRSAPILAQTAVTMSIDPANTQVEVGDTFTVDVVVDADVELVNAAQALVEFDTAVLQVVEPTTAGTTLPVTLINATNNSAGTVTYSAGIFGSTVTGSFILLSIEFEAVGTTTGSDITLNTDPQEITRSRVNDQGGINILETVNPGTVVVEGNLPPTADAGTNQTVTDNDNNGNEDVTLDGSGSDDSDGTIVSYEWSESGSPIATGISPTVNFAIGSHTVTLTVTDDDGETDNDDVVITVNEPDNQAPTADAGDDQTVTDSNGNGSENVALNGSGSDDNDGSIVSYDWSENGSTIATGVNPNVNFSLGSHTVVLTVTDNDGATGTDTVVITVNDPPTADAGIDQMVTDSDDGGDEDVILDGSGSDDSDGTIVSYAWSEAGSQIATGANPTVNLDVGTHTIILTVTDDQGATDTDAVEIIVEEFTAPDDVFIVVNPQVSTVGIGDIFSVVIQVEAGSQLVDGAEAHLDFDSALLQVTDLTPGTTMPAILANGYSNDDGEVDYAAGVLPPTPLPSGTFDLVTIEFEALAETATTDLSFNFVFPRATKATYQGALILSGATDGEVIVEANDAPAADDQVVDVDEDGSLGITLTASDNEGDPLTYEVVDQPQNGSLSGVAPNLTYDPDPDFNGSDSFTFKANDGESDSNTATIDITVNPVNDDPVAVDDDADTDEDISVDVAVLDNDGDVDGDTLSVDSITQPANGTTTINLDDTIEYDPDLNFCGSDSFTYTVSDGNGGTDVAPVAVDVSCQNDAPVVVDDTATTNEDTSVEIDVLGNDGDVDGDTLSVTAVSSSSNGTVTINLDDTVEYDPNPNFCGSDAFTYTVSDGNSGIDIGLVDVEVTCQNDDPVAVDDNASTDEDVSVDIDVLDNDGDVDGDTLSVTAVSSSANGTTTINLDDTIEYDPDANFCGSDSFTYTVSDGNGGTDVAPVDVDVSCQNDDPVAVDDDASTDEDASVDIDVLDNDSDVDGDTLNVDSLTQPANGTATLNLDNTITYDPDVDFDGSDSFTYTISDGNGGTDTATVNVTVAAVPEAVILGSVDLQGRPAKPDARWSVPLTVRLYEVGADTPTYEFTLASDNNGEFTINAEIAPGTYEIAIKNSHTLQNVVTVELLDGDNNINFGTLLEGDADNDNTVTLLDFSLLATAFNSNLGDAMFNPQADFNEDGFISLLDFSLLSTNYNVAGQEVSGLQP